MHDEIKQLFEEEAYLARHPDIAAAVKSGRLKSGFDHFIRRGQHEGRAISGFQPGVYLTAYPLAAEEIAAGRAANAIEHFIKFGRARGYLPTPIAPRPDNAAALQNRFGGFWYDQPNAMDIVDGKLEVGQISVDQAEQLRLWIREGYFILRNAIEPDVLDAAVEDFNRGYSGKLPGLRFECPDVVGNRSSQPWQAKMNEYPAKALDIHFHSQAIRNLIFSAEIAKFLAILFDAPAFATQSLGFLLGSAQEAHQDSAYVAYSIPLQFCATWIALEDVTEGAGELFYYPRSHRFPNFLYGGNYKSNYEANRLSPGGAAKGEVARHVKSLKENVTQFGLAAQTLLIKKGDVLFWHADLVHGGSRVSTEVTRKSVVTHYCPKYVAPLYSETRKTKLYSHGNHRYTTSYYLFSDPDA